MSTASGLPLASICLTMFTPKPDVADADWVAYENGTVVMFTQKEVNDKEELIRRADEAIAVEVHVGTPSADFTVARLDTYFPDKDIYAVLYSLPENMITIIENERGNDLSTGLLGRENRRLDWETRTIVATSRD
ncbi:hypothetical protein INT44_000023 [Umbelopsis vinacea]|uniref:Uncharacterized protein n=1 Tax=Umbelopsis vinacea TaxID=44442 RepID=A0A8H7PHF6_9FUNG|nr:hypothetical protein INT44_000023 [Umbelopsis vinacea]